MKTTVSTSISKSPSSTDGSLDTTERLYRLRQLMSQYDLHAYVIPTEDAHQSEYIAECDKRREYISGFTGSAGLAVVTIDSAYLFTDGRYYLQASRQLDKNWTLMKQGLVDVPTWQEFLISLPNSSRVGIDPTLISLPEARSLTKNLLAKKSSLVSIAENLVDAIWGKEQPPRPKLSISVLPLKYCGLSRAQKLKDLRETLVTRSTSTGAAAKSNIDSKDSATNNEIPAGVSGIIFSSLDDIAWLLNARGNDIDFNPVFFSYVHVGIHGNVILYVDKEKVDDETQRELTKDGIEIRPYDSILRDLKSMSSRLLAEHKRVLLTSKASLALAETIGNENFEVVRSPVTDAKAVKNETELEGMRRCHLRDGAAIVRYFAWLQEQLRDGVYLDEVDGAEQLLKFRMEQERFVGLSFTTISSAGANAAIIHYSPQKGTCSRINPQKIYLCDSGAQYLDGTTDTTRTIHFGMPTSEQKRAFTRVLQGHIAIDQLVFPKGTTGYLLDVFARAALWKDGLDFRHGTGHGVGSYLNVHEGPHGIGTRIAYNDVALVSGMTVSNEPGFYKDGEFGVRIENIVLVKQVKTPNRFGDREYLGFEHVTMVPIQTALIEIDLLTPAEKAWVNSYNHEVATKLEPLLTMDLRAIKYLEEQTKPIL